MENNSKKTTNQLITQILIIAAAVSLLISGAFLGKYFLHRYKWREEISDVEIIETRVLKEVNKYYLSKAYKDDNMYIVSSVIQKTSNSKAESAFVVYYHSGKFRGDLDIYTKNHLLFDSFSKLMYSSTTDFLPDDIGTNFFLYGYKLPITFAVISVVLFVSPTIIKKIRPDEQKEEVLFGQ